MNQLKFLHFLGETPQQWLILAAAILLEVVLGRQAFDLSLLLVEILRWAIVVGAAILVAHPIVLGQGSMKIVEVAYAMALVAGAFAIAEFTVLIRVWSLVQLVTAPAIGGLIGLCVGKIAQVVGRKPVVTVSESM